MPDLDDWVAAAYAEITVSQQPAAAEDTAAITTRAEPLLASLSARDIYTGTADDIPDDAFNALTCLLAEAVAPLFGRERDLQRVVFYEAQLRAQTRTKVDATPYRALYY